MGATLLLFYCFGAARVAHLACKMEADRTHCYPPEWYWWLAFIGAPVIVLAFLWDFFKVLFKIGGF